MKPLDGLTMLELSRGPACAHAGRILAELGASVIRVEPPGGGGDFAWHRAKASLALRLEHEDGRRIVRELAQRSDALLEDCPPGALAREGLDYAVLSSLNPRLICVSCAGAGEGAGPWAALALLAALAGRGRTGHGARVDCLGHGGAGGFDFPGAGEVKARALPYRFLGWDDPQIGAPPVPGAHTEAILKERLGYSDARIAALRAAGAI